MAAGVTVPFRDKNGFRPSQPAFLCTGKRLHRILRSCNEEALRRLFQYTAEAGGSRLLQKSPVHILRHSHAQALKPPCAGGGIPGFPAWRILNEVRCAFPVL